MGPVLKKFLLVLLLTYLSLIMPKGVAQKRKKAPAVIAGYARGEGGRLTVIKTAGTSTIAKAAKAATPSPPKRTANVRIQAPSKRTKLTHSDVCNNPIVKLGTALGTEVAHMVKTETLSAAPLAGCFSTFACSVLSDNEQKKELLTEFTTQMGFELVNGRIPSAYCQPILEKGTVIESVNLDAFQWKKHDITVAQKSVNSAKSNQRLAIDKLVGALSFCGTKIHATCALFKVMRKPEWRGVATSLGMLKDPDREKQTDHTIVNNLRQMLHSEKVWERQTNESIEHQYGTFFRICPTMPPDDCSAQDRRRWKTDMKNIIYRLDMKGEAMRKWCYEMSKYKREQLQNPELSINPRYQRKPPSNKMLTIEKLHQFKVWMIRDSESVVDSPDQKDMKQKRHPLTKKVMRDQDGKPMMQRKYYYKLSLNRLWLEATKLDTGFKGFRKDDGKGEVCVHRTTMDKMVKMLGCFSLLSESQSRGCLCVDCLNGQYLHADWLAHRMEL